MVFQEASKGFASMADELAKNKKFNKSRQSIDAGDDSLALQVEKSLRKKKFGGENSDFVAPKLKPVEKQDNKTTGQSGEKRKSFVPLPSGKSFEKDETENKGEEEPVTQKPGLISNCINIAIIMRLLFKLPSVKTSRTSTENKETLSE